MLKKVILAAFILSSLGAFSFAQTTGDDTTNNIEQSVQTTSLSTDLLENKTTLLEKLDAKKQSLVESLQHVEKSLGTDDEYNILNKIGKIDVENPSNKNLSEYFSLKTNILLDYNNISSNIIILEEKKNLELVTGQEYDLQVNVLEQDVANFESKFKDLIDTYFVDGDERIESFFEEVESVKKGNIELLANFSANKLKIEKLVTEYEDLKKLIKKVNVVYVGNYDTLTDFLVEVKALVNDSLDGSLQTKLANYNKKYVNLPYYAEDINDKIQALKTTYENEIQDYFDELFDGFYEQTDIDFIESNYSVFRSTYYDGDQFSYALLNDNLDLGENYDRLSEKITKVTGVINQKLAEFDNPQELEDLKVSVQNKIIEHHDSQKVTKIDSFDKFLNKQVELLGYKLKEELSSYNNLQDSIKAVETVQGTSTDRIIAIDNALKAIEHAKNNIISQDLRGDLDSNYWELQLQLIDQMIIKKGYSKYNKNYKNIDDQLKAIMGSIATGFENQGNIDDLNLRVNNALNKIEVFLNTDGVSDKSKYLLMKIKKVFIWFKYLR